MGAASLPTGEDDLSRRQLRLRELLRRLRDNDAVEDVVLKDHRTPERVAVLLNQDTTPPGVTDAIEVFEATIHDPRCTEDGLAFDLTCEHEFKAEGSMQIREHGNSKVVTVPTDALDSSHLQLGDRLDIEARPGQLRFTRR